LALRSGGGQTKTCPSFIRALHGTARLRRLKMDKLELSAKFLKGGTQRRDAVCGGCAPVGPTPTAWPGH
jgi:hypothetical protein